MRMLKPTIGRDRPENDEPERLEEDWSFPSGHAAGSFAVYSLLTYLILRERRTAGTISC